MRLLILFLVCSIHISHTSFSQLTLTIKRGGLPKSDLESGSQQSIKEIIWKEPVSVCWETPGFDTEKAWVQAAISDTWQSESNLEFACWCPCNEQSNGIRIAIQDSQPKVLTIGANLDGVRSGMILNFQLQNWGSSLVPGIIESRKLVIQAIAVHEFGHAIGLTHQHSRNDCINCFTEFQDPALFSGLDAEKSNSALWYTPCDQNSVMNYCNDDYFNSGVLSLYDKEVVQIIYGKRNSLTSNTPADYKLSYSVRDAPRSAPDTHQRQRQGIPKVIYKVTGHTWYQVTGFITASETHMMNIKKVKYYLHPTYAANRYTVRDAKSRFGTAFLAWGRFILKAKIYLKNSKDPIVLEQDLKEIKPVKVVYREREFLFSNKNGSL